MKRNFKRHSTILLRLVLECQIAGQIVNAPPSQVIGFIMSGIQMPNIIAGQLSSIRKFPKEVQKFQQLVLSDEAIVQRVEFALKGVAN